MEKIQDQIINYLRENQTTTASNLAVALNVTVANIRYHLNSMIKNGIVEILDEINLNQRGRPTRIYSLSKKEKSTGNVMLLRSFLLELRSIKNLRIKNNRIKKLADFIVGHEVTQQSLTLRLGYAVSRLNELDYKARWEAHPDSPQIIFQNCPFSSLVEAFPEICIYDRFILENLLGSNVVQTGKLVATKGNHPFCSFKIP